MSSGLAYAIYYQALERLGPTMTSYATYLSPVVALFIGWVVLGERISLIGYVGILHRRRRGTDGFGIEPDRASTG